MQISDLKNFKKIYVLCPANIKTGGPELLHQLVYSLNRINKDANIVYFNIDSKEYKIIPEYNEYTNRYCILNEIEDNESNLIITCETQIAILNKFKNIKKSIWWLSVDNYFVVYDEKISFMYRNMNFFQSLEYLIKYPIKKFFNKINNVEEIIRSCDFNFCQSWYAMDFCQKRNLINVLYLSDYLNDNFLNSKAFFSKENIILYNPKKGYKYTKKIINKFRNLNFVPLINLSRNDVINLMQKAKIYIDFGNHPGKDRMPREACISGCVVITNKKGSAKFKNDVPIPDENKFDTSHIDINLVGNKLKNILDNYDKEFLKMNNYINYIKSEHRIFEDQVNSYFKE